MFGEGISKAGEIIEYGVDLNVIKKSGAWFSYADSKIGQGKEGVRKILNDNPELMEELEEKVREAINANLSSDKSSSFSSFASKDKNKSKEEGDSHYDDDDDFSSMAAEGDEEFFEEDIEIEE